MAGNTEPGFDIYALQALRNILNYDHHIYKYYGSGTTPPCEENVEWFVFAQPRSASKDQIDFLKR